MKIGDKVKVRRDLIVGEEYGRAYFIQEMVQFLGRESLIDEELYEGSYGLEIDSKSLFEFPEEMLELLESN